MRILHFGPHGGENGVFSLLEGFRNLGHPVETCNIIRISNTAGKAEDAIRTFKPDIVLTIGGWHEHFDAQALWRVVEKHGIPNVYWAIEDPTFFDWASTVHVDKYDLVFTVSEECVERYYRLGVPAVYLPYCCNPRFHKRVPPQDEFRNDIIVLSNKYEEKDPARCAFRNACYRNIVEPVLRTGYDIKIYGRGWKEWEPGIPEEKLGGYVSRNKVPLIYSSAKMVLMIQWDLTGHVCFKTYEALACRCFQIAPYTPVQEKYFTHGIHLVYSSCPEETLHYVDYYLRHEDEREDIAAMGQKEAYERHNCDIRAERAVEALRHFGFA